jgi:hypothetical protein
VSARGTATKKAPATTKKAKAAAPRREAGEEHAEMVHDAVWLAAFGDVWNMKDSKEFTHKGSRSPAHGPAGAGIFDTELLRYSGGWTADTSTTPTYVFDGSHGSDAFAKGKIMWSVEGTASGVSLTEKFEDPRKEPYGPLPRDTWGLYKGLYRKWPAGDPELHDRRCEVLDMRPQRVIDGMRFFTRSMEMGHRRRPSRSCWLRIPIRPQRSRRRRPVIFRSSRMCRAGI